MLATIWMCTQEWSLIPSRFTALTFATCHQALRPSSALTRSRILRSFALRCAGTLIRICAVASRGESRASRSASADAGSSIRSRSSLSTWDTAARAYYDSVDAHDGRHPRLGLLLGRGLRGDPRREVDGGARPRPLGGAAPLLRARALLPRNQPADALRAATGARAGGDPRPPQLPGVAAARRVQADAEGRGPAADHRGDEPLRARLAPRGRSATRLARPKTCRAHGPSRAREARTRRAAARWASGCCSREARSR